jgi:MYXO-CTERM domain-containing protein
MFCVHTTHHVVDDDPYWMYFVPAFQEEPHNAIHIPSMSNQLYHYGSALFAEYLDVRFGDGDGTLAASLWRSARQDGTVTLDDYWLTADVENEPDLFDAIDAYLQREHSTTFRDALVEFAEWRLILGARDDGEHFPEGSQWRGAEVTVAERFAPIDLPIVDETIARPVQPTGTSYVRVDTDDLEGGEQLRLAIDLDDDTDWAVQVFRLMDDAPAEVHAVELVEHHGELTLAVAGAEMLVLGVTNLGDEDFDGDDYPVDSSGFTYSLEILSQPVVTAIEPAAATAGTSGVEVVVTASPLSDEATLSLGEGVTVSVTGVEGDRLTATIDLDLLATPGPRDVTVTNPSSDPGVLAGGFEILALPAPTLMSVTPNELEPGAELTLTVSGNGFLEGAQADLGGGITIDHADVVDATRMLLTISVSNDAAPGSRPLTVSNPGSAAATLSDAVTVLSDQESGGCSCSASDPRRSASRGVPILLVSLLFLALRRRR